MSGSSGRGLFDPREWLERLDLVGFERVRRAVAALGLSFFAILYFFIGMNPPLPGWEAPFLALSACYLIGFFGVVGEWFWGRWFASGLGWSGVMVAVIFLFLMGWDPGLAIYGGLHALVVVPLAGKSMAARYDLQEAWRQRYNMDDLGVARLRKTITRSAAALPSVILTALAPKEPGQGMILSLAALALVGLGLGGLVRLRTWGWVAVAGAFVASVLGGSNLFGSLSFTAVAGRDLAIVLLLAAAAPFAMPAVRFVRARV
jgi:hypothetical protein